MADGLHWTTKNASIHLQGSYCYDNRESNCSLYGRLYTYESAPKACQALGHGWRLPTDSEWRRLALLHGGISADGADKGKSAYQALISGGTSGFNAVLGGGRDGAGQYARGDAHGFYWTSSESDPNGAYFYNFGKGGLALHRQNNGEKDRAFSVRCVRD
jgi:uncharacterized protein (TIGR02145 family)